LGLFVELEEGVDGLIHISDLSWTKKIKHPAEFTNIGDEYISKYTIELSLADSDGVVKVSRVISDSFKLSNPLTPKDPVQFRTNYIELHALKANYTAQIRVIDNSTKILTNLPSH